MARDRSALWLAVGYAWQLGYTIAIPLVLLTLGGRLLDKRFGTHPWLLVTGVILSMVISSVALVVRAGKLMSDVNRPDSSPRNGNLPRR